ncbi:fatty acid desaturase family protein [Luteibaculum oceani]|uniref:Fatty acid desaturase domain-containing protein n=1 Tax=Luteibaculum oceani TaxID=1294296 RepID=A0A5C6URG7_9FLAO|nr:hypothetical protein [Luteibaculum oceani]TXC75599.1 hypothetical protein FRX97_11835 [Luteibaculum oceani]
MKMKALSNNFIRWILYHFGVFISLVFLGLYHWDLGYLFLPFLIITNQLNNFLGAFTDSEIASEMMFFSSNPSFQLSKFLVCIYYLLWNAYVFYWIGSNELGIFSLLGFTVGSVIINSTFAVSLAHDLLHRKSWLRYLLSQAILMLVVMPYFKNDHLLGHHKTVGTESDIGTARLNQSLYQYLKDIFVHRISLSYFKGYHNNVVKRKKVITENWILLLVNVTLIAAVIVWSSNPLQIVSFVLLQSMLCYLMFEVANYIQHYGLERQSVSDKLDVNHAWDYTHKYTSYISYLLPLHSYHHAGIISTQESRTENRTILPNCYYKMILLSFIPRLWFKKMNPLCNSLRRGKVLRAAAVVVFLVFGGISQAQHNFGLKYFGLSMHPKGDPQAHLMPYRLDDRAVLVVNFGGIASFERYVYSNLLSIKLAQGLYTDSGGLISGHTHIGFRAKFLERKRHSMILGFGPTFIYRRNWNKKPGYESTGLFRESGNIQHKFVWYGGEIEYNYQVSDQWDMSVNFLPGYPLVMSIGVGVRYWPIRY